VRLRFDRNYQAIRPHALGRFPDLVRATARHPAMLFYLDNWVSAREGFTVPVGPARGRTLGLNENYARELMELHTLGVDGGYTQQDVIEVARILTGWTIDRPQDGEMLYKVAQAYAMTDARDDAFRVLAREVLTGSDGPARPAAVSAISSTSPAPDAPARCSSTCRWTRR